jgi:hypothetical protein
MPRAGFELTIPTFERSTIIRTLDSTATGTGRRRRIKKGKETGIAKPTKVSMQRK